MCDDIDVEEHDLLDNPIIRNIFPDITVIKKEILHYEEDLEISTEYLHSKSVPTCGSCDGKQSNREINDTTRLCDNNEEDIESTMYEDSVDMTPSVILAEPLDTKEDSMYPTTTAYSYEGFRGNRIILGSKPSEIIAVDEDHDNQAVTKINYEEFIQQQLLCCNVEVRLNNLEHYFDTCGRYCKECLILFSGKHAFDIHMRDTHFQHFRLATTYDNTNIGLHKPGKKKITTYIPRVQKKSYNCFHCDKKFRTSKFLIDHLYKVLPAKQNKCHLCSKIFLNRNLLNQHIHEHKNAEDFVVNSNYDQNNEDDGEAETRSTNCVEPSTSLQREVTCSTNSKIHQDSAQAERYYWGYRCSVCFNLFELKKYYLKHMLYRHKLRAHAEQLKKCKFIPYCKFCSRSYGVLAKFKHHLYRCHSDKINARVDKAASIDCQQEILSLGTNTKQDEAINTNILEKSETAVLKNVLFKCTKCDIHFLTAEIGTNHTDHMEMLINWKCLSCKRIFKKEDSMLHEEQHKVWKDFTVYDLCAEPLSRLLYNCPKCTIHYFEDHFTSHYYNCEKGIPNSIYCKICDILIDVNAASLHETEHTGLKLSANDFKIINAELETGTGLETNENEELSYKEHNTVYSYCSVCKCFLNSGYTGPTHFKQRCFRFNKSFCKVCGLFVARKYYLKHVDFHKNNAKVTLKDYIFYDLNGHQINPPIPELPKCHNCDVHFVSLNRSNLHICHQIVYSYRKCSFCNIKLTEEAFKLHMPFHTYAKNKKLVQPSLDIRALPEEENYVEMAEESRLKDKPSNEVEMPTIIYCCQNCHISFDDYDKVVEHCQNHIGYKEHHINAFTCEFCHLKLDKSCHPTHLQLHSSRLNDKNFMVLNFDSFYFTSENKIWLQHVFGNIPGEMVSKVISNSIYKHETRIKMEVLQNGSPDLTVYKCDKCSTFIDETEIYKHAENSCFKLRKHPCSFCGIPYISSLARIQHETIHTDPNIGLKSYRIVTFNKSDHETINKLLYARSQYHVLYRCRNCCGVVDQHQTKSHKCNIPSLKKCVNCEMYLHKNDHERHMLRHKEIKSFIQKNIKVILFGDKSGNKTVNSQGINTVVFKGMVFDYTLYSCSECKTCVKNIENTLKHTCPFGVNRFKCSYCGLYFYNSMLKRHNEMHEIDKEFVRENMRIIPFCPPGRGSEGSGIYKRELSHANGRSSDISEDNGELETSIQANTADQDVKIYKCRCGVHFLEPSSILAHMKICNSKLRSTKLRCSKCSLLFTSTVLFKHLLKHHGDKSQNFKFVVVDMSKANIIYKCGKCNLHMGRNSDAACKHFEHCEGTSEGSVCIVCDIKYTAECFKSHDCNTKCEIFDLCS